MRKSRINVTGRDDHASHEEGIVRCRVRTSGVVVQLQWPVVQHFTVAEFRAALGIDAQPVGLGDGISRKFPGITVTYQHRP
jgi:hypothetical protein